MRATTMRLAVAAMVAGALAGVVPQFPFDKNTNPKCSFWHDNVGTEDTECWMIPALWEITPEQFIAWNPVISYDTCTPYNLNQSYCVKVCEDCATTTTVLTTSSTSTKTSTSTTTTKTRAPIITPTPTQSGMVKNCIAFHLIEDGDTCAIVAANNAILLGTLVSYNGGDKLMCSAPKVGTHFCVATADAPTATSTPTTTSSTPANSTPTPIQSGMVAGCSKFYLVQDGDTCATIAQKNGILLGNLTKWNPAAMGGSKCNGLLPGYYACVAV